MSDLEKFSSDSAMVSFFFAKGLSKLITFSTPFIIKDNMFNDISRRCIFIIHKDLFRNNENSTYLKLQELRLDHM